MHFEAFERGSLHFLEASITIPRYDFLLKRSPRSYWSLAQSYPFAVVGLRYAWVFKIFFLQGKKATSIQYWLQALSLTGSLFSWLKQFPAFVNHWKTRRSVDSKTQRQQKYWWQQASLDLETQMQRTWNKQILDLAKTDRNKSRNSKEVVPKKMTAFFDGSAPLLSPHVSVQFLSTT